MFKNRKPRRRLTDAQRRAVLAELLLVGAITPDEWMRRNDQLDRRYAVLGWTFVIVYLLGILVCLAAIVGGIWAFVGLVTSVTGTL